jgi:eukaryotic-like serine/threonine-protein kinase
VSGLGSAGLYVGGYLLERRIATGGMAEVWLARKDGPAGFQKQLVVKKLLPHLSERREFIEMFFNEARLAARLSHANVTQIYDFGESNGTYFLVMEYVDGQSLRRVERRAAERGGGIPVPVAASIVAKVAEGLHHAHELRDEGGRLLRLVHRDISPENILISYDGQVKLTDFGIAKATAETAMTRAGVVKGKLAYMPPEQAVGDPLDRRADIYALGVVLYEMLANSPMYSSAELRTGDLPPPEPIGRRRPETPPELARLVTSAISTDKRARPQDAREMGTALENYLAQASVPTSQLALYMDTIFPEHRALAHPQDCTGDTTLDLVGLQSASTAPDQAADSMFSTSRGEDQPTIIGASNEPSRSRWPVAVGAMVVAVPLVWLAVSSYFASRDSQWRMEVVEIKAQPPAAAPRAATPRERSEAAQPKDPTSPTPSEPALAPPAAEAPPVAKAAPRPRAEPVSTKKGRLLVRVHPWADVLIDSSAAGMTPLAPIELAPGKHTVTAVNPDLKAKKSVTVEVRSSKDTLVEINLLAP